MMQRIVGVILILSGLGGSVINDATNEGSRPVLYLCITVALAGVMVIGYAYRQRHSQRSASS